MYRRSDTCVYTPMPAVSEALLIGACEPVETLLDPRSRNVTCHSCVSTTRRCTDHDQSYTLPGCGDRKMVVNLKWSDFSLKDGRIQAACTHSSASAVGARSTNTYRHGLQVLDQQPLLANWECCQKLPDCLPDMAEDAIGIG